VTGASPRSPTRFSAKRLPLTADNLMYAEDGAEEAESERTLRFELLDDVPGTGATLVRVGPSQVEIELVEGGIAQEVGATGKGLQIEELIFVNHWIVLHLTNVKSVW